MKHPITKTRNGIAVYVDLVHSDAAARIAQQPYLLGLVKELLEKTNAKTPVVRIDHDMGRPLGYTYVVETSEKDTILYAQRVRESVFTRFVKNGTPLTTPYLSISLQRNEDGDYELLDTWLGRLNPPLPGTTDETDVSRTYWANHAFVLDYQPLQLRTLTKVCPY